MSRPRPSHEIAASGFFALRTPLLPFEVLERWSSDLGAPACARTGEGLADALALDVATLTERLRALVREPEIREALFCASPSLDHAITAWLEDAASPRAHGVVPILVRYLTRMTTRATPFGLFSGCSVGQVGSASRLRLAPRGAYLRRSRLDMGYLCLLVAGLEANHALRERMRFRRSSGLYWSADQLRYAEARIDPETRARSYHLVSVDGSGALRAALERARLGALPGEIAEAVAGAVPDVSADEALAFVHELIDAQILVSELAPALTGPEPIACAVEVLRRAPAGELAASALGRAREDLAALDEGGLGARPARYGVIASGLGALDTKVELARLFQVDLFKPVALARLGEGVVKEIARGVELYRRIGARADRAALTAFREAFEKRYDQREVPLCEALDEDCGIGFGRRASDACPLLHGLDFAKHAEPAGPVDGRRQGWLHRRHAELTRAGALEWQLDARDLTELAVDPASDLPDAFYAGVVVAATSEEACDAGDFRLTLGVSGPSGAGLLGRFCHGDPELRRLVEDHLRAEEALQPDAIFAEVVHLPEGRVGNVLCRPLLRAHEIPYLGQSGAPHEQQIGIEELFVSLRGERIVLTCRRLGREIVPRMTTAHAHFGSSHAMYRFLCALGGQECAGAFHWDWGPLGAAPFLPRVTSGRLVLSLAQWTLSAEQVTGVLALEGVERFRAVQRLREELGLPRWLHFGEVDQLLLVDLDNALSIETWLALVKPEPAVLRESFPRPDELCVRGPEGRFLQELVVPFVRCKAPVRAEKLAPPPRLRRVFPPGSEWLTLKVYSGTAMVDHVLTDLVAPVLREALSSGDVDRWFFLRYGDPDWHLRLRLHGPAAALLTSVLPKLERGLAPLLADGRASRITVDTYVREIERYGGDAGIDLAEALFDADSSRALAILEHSSGDERADARWRAALAGMDALLSDLGLERARRIALLQRLRVGFGAELRADVDLLRQIGAKFRAERGALEALLAAPAARSPASSTDGVASSTFEQRSRVASPIATELAARAARGELGVGIDDLAASLLHMHCNRLLSAEPRAHELVLYDFLLRLYESEAARAKAAPRALRTAGG